jgi:hypothetical protein
VTATTYPAPTKNTAPAGASLSATEQQVLLLSPSVENESHYPVAARSAIATNQQVPIDTVETRPSVAKVMSSAIAASRSVVTSPSGDLPNGITRGRDPAGNSPRPPSRCTGQPAPRKNVKDHQQLVARS